MAHSYGIRNFDSLHFITRPAIPVRPDFHPAAGTPLTGRACAAEWHTRYSTRSGSYPVARPVALLFQCAVADGMLTLKPYGRIKAMEGVTDQRSVHSACT
ncbi:MAG: hypothetical protein Q8K05_05520 [Polaromonas sp.]|jgi:hypothetical protein|uniref:hypothetical protein n=1 Tax=Polaromonas sp. TaxID=1869339 RepID=UPI002730DACD|nr:hypothetical protein [Polaromonas sp.]MDP2255506.1 hypothetical protein [Polaromonas sp.]